MLLQEMEERFALDIPGACSAIGKQGPSSPSVLVMHGAADPICQQSDAEQLARSIAGAQLVVVEGADHWYNNMEQQLLEAVEHFAVSAWRARTAAAS